MSARKPGRYLALLALVAAIIATVLVVRSGLSSPHHITTTATTRVSPPHKTRPPKKFYVVRTGDTLSSISLKTGVSVGDLQALNPAVASDPNTLQTGQRLRLR